MLTQLSRTIMKNNSNKTNLPPLPTTTAQATLPLHLIPLILMNTITIQNEAVTLLSTNKKMTKKEKKEKKKNTNCNITRMNLLPLQSGFVGKIKTSRMNSSIRILRSKTKMLIIINSVVEVVIPRIATITMMTKKMMMIILHRSKTLRFCFSAPTSNAGNENLRSSVNESIWRPSYGIANGPHFNKKKRFFIKPKRKWMLRRKNLVNEDNVTMKRNLRLELKIVSPRTKGQC